MMDALELVESFTPERGEQAVGAAMELLESRPSDEILLRLDAALAKLERLPPLLNRTLAERLAPKHPERALLSARRALEVAPRDPAVNALVGRLHLELGQALDAVAPLQIAIWEAPEDWRSFLVLAQALAATDRKQAALMYLNEVAFRVPDLADAQLSIGEAYASVGARRLALPHLKVAAAGTDPLTRLSLGIALLAEGKLVEAESALRASMRLGASPTEVRRRIAAVLDPEGSIAAARKTLKELAKAGQSEVAVTSLLEVLGEDPLDPDKSGPEFSGDLLSFGIPELLDFFCNQRATGVIHVNTPLEEARIGLHRGKLTGLMVSGHPTLREVLVKEGLISEGIMESSLVREDDKDFEPTLIAALMRDGWLTKDELEDRVRDHWIHLLLQIHDWRDGRATFAATDPDTTPAAINFDTRTLLLEVAWRADERRA